MSFRDALKAAGQRTATRSPRDQVQQLKFLRNRVTVQPRDTPLGLVVCLLLDSQPLQSDIWKAFVDSGKDSGFQIRLLVASTDPARHNCLPAEFKAPLDLSALASRGLGAGPARLEASLSLLRIALQTPSAMMNVTHVALVSGDAVPVASGADIARQLKINESWVPFARSAAFHVRRGEGTLWSGLEWADHIDNNWIDVQFLRRVERFGYIFCKHHVQLFFEADKAVDRPLSSLWAGMKTYHRDDGINTYFPTLLALLGYTDSAPEGPGTGPAASKVVSRRTMYSHFVGYENERGSIDCAKFRVDKLSIDMVREFLSSGACFAADFLFPGDGKEGLTRSLQVWKSVVLDRRPAVMPFGMVGVEGSAVAEDVDFGDFYTFNSPIIRYGGAPKDYDNLLAGYLNSRARTSIPLLDQISSSVTSGHPVGVESLKDTDNSSLLGKRAREENDEANAPSSKEAKIESSYSSLFAFYYDSVQKAPMTSKGFRNVKIVLNSHVKYRRPLSVLLQSILDSDVGLRYLEDGNFSGHVFGWEVIVSLAANEENVGPQRVLASEIADIVPKPGAPMPYVTVVRSELNSYDWTAKSALYRYRDHSLIESDYYVYILDTSKVQSQFRTLSSQVIPVVTVSQVVPSAGAEPKWVVSSSDKTRERLYITPCPHSSISIFGRGVIQNWAHNFDRAISKNDGLTLEMFEKPIFYEDGFVQHGVTRFGNMIRLQHRSTLGPCDWYPEPSSSTARPPQRTVYHYPDIGIYKAILIGSTGDMTGDKLKSLQLSANIAKI